LRYLYTLALSLVKNDIFSLLKTLQSREDYVYIADMKNHRIQKFDGNGNFITMWGSEGEGDGQLKNPAGVAIDTSDNVYVTDQDNGRIQKFTSDGQYLTKWGSPGNGDGQFAEPEGIDVDSQGRVYVADTGNNRIQVFAQAPA
jgi:tripartite motif-containing protein 71